MFSINLRLDGDVLINLYPDILIEKLNLFYVFDSLCSDIVESAV